MSEQQRQSLYWSDRFTHTCILFLNKWSNFRKKFAKILFVQSYKISKAVWIFRGELFQWSMVCSKLFSPIYPCTRPSPRPPPATSNSSAALSIIIEHTHTHKKKKKKKKNATFSSSSLTSLFNTMVADNKTCRTNTCHVNKTETCRSETCMSYTCMLRQPM